MSDDRFNEYCEGLLASYKRRNTRTVTQRLESLCGFLRQKGNVVQTMFGGSVRKGTYVTGLSDVDALLIVNQSSLVNQPPARAIEYVRDTIQDRLRQNIVSAGNLAVTVSYSDGIEIQILPAIRTNSGGVRIADLGSNQWSNVARPDDFARKLAEVNTARDGRVVPIIKLAQAMADFLEGPSPGLGSLTLSHVHHLGVVVDHAGVQTWEPPFRHGDSEQAGVTGLDGRGQVELLARFDPPVPLGGQVAVPSDHDPEGLFEGAHPGLHGRQLLWVEAEISGRPDLPLLVRKYAAHDIRGGLLNHPFRMLNPISLVKSYTMTACEPSLGS